ncbi:MAG: ATP-dependent DNA helicase [Candidatus Humimicrobiaceae bacterium]
MLNKLLAKSSKGQNLLVAGAPGTGKTEILIRLLENLINKRGASPDRIIVFCFNRKWAKFLREETAVRINKSFSEIAINTFHSYCLDFLNSNNEGLSPVEILKSTEQWNLLKNIIRGLDKKYYPVSNRYIYGNKYIANSFTQEVFDFILRAQENLLSPQDISSKFNPFINKALNEIGGIYRRYLEELKKTGNYNYGLLLQKTYSLLRGNHSIVEETREKYDYIIVDELQEINRAQLEIVRLISSNNCIFFGNDDEAIFSFRGSMANSFRKIHGAIESRNLIWLRHNYRNSRKINDLAHNFISQNKGRIKKEVNSKNGGGEAIIKTFYSPVEEADFICNRIKSLLQKEKVKPHDIAIIIKGLGYETHLIENALKQKGIPFLRRGSRAILDNSHVRYILDLLRLIGSVDREKIDRTAESIILTLGLEPFLFQKIKKTYIKEKSRHKNILGLLKSSGEEFSGFLSALEKYRKLKAKSVFKLAADLVMDKKIGLAGNFKEIDSEIIGDFLDSVKNFVKSNRKHDLRSYLDFLDGLEENQFLEELEESTKDFKKAGKVNVLSFHQCKGLEFEAVFIPFINYGYIPASFSYPQSYDVQLFNYFNSKEKVNREEIKEGHYEDERRLFYIGLTRANKFLYISSSSVKGESQFFIELKKIKENLGIRDNVKDISYSKKENWGIRKRALVQTYKKNKGMHYKRDKYLGYLDYLKNNFPKHSWWGCIKFTENKNNPFKIFKKHFSYSDLETYRECPLKYKYSRLFYLKAEESMSLVVGKAYHKIIQNFFSKGLFDWENLKEIIETIFRNIEFEFKASREELKKKAIEDFSNFFNNFMPENPSNSINEKPFHFKLDGEVIKGRIDQINFSNNQIELVDYKSSATGYTSNDLTDEIQLKVYRMASKLSKDLNFLKNGNIKLKYICLGDDKKTVFEVPSGTYDENDLRKRIKLIIKDIKGENFNPQKGYLSCFNCDYKILCSKYYG